MNREVVEKTVLGVLAAVLKCQVDLETSRSNTRQWDSLKHIEVIFALEDELKVQFSKGEMSHMDSVSKIVSRVFDRHET
jgi:acyl carrier protein